MAAILMPKRERGTGVQETCTEVVLWGVRATDLELGEALTHGWQKPGGKIRAADFGLGKQITHVGQNPGSKVREANPSCGFLDLENHSSTGGKFREGGGGKIWATDFGL